MMKKGFLMLCILIGIMMCFTSCGYQVSVSEFQGKQGNTNLNINQGGFAARDGDYIYFNVDNILYEMDIRDEKIISIPNINPIFGYLNVIHPYVICSAEDPLKPSRSPYLAIHRLDGKYKKILDKLMHVPILVKDEWVYATMVKDTPLYRMRVDGTKKSILTDEAVAEFHIIGEWIYYRSEFKLRKMKLDGSEKSDILPEATVSGYYIESDMDTIFYRDLEDEGKIYKASLSGNFPSEKKVDYPCIYFQKKNEDIFFANEDEDLYVMSLTKNNPKPRLIARDIDSLNILDDIVLVKDNNMQVYMLDQDYQLKILEIPESENS